MESIEKVKNLYKGWQEYENGTYEDGETLDTHYTEQEKKCIFLSDGVFGITTYDEGLSLDFGKMILETMVHIKNKTNYEYIKEDEENYKNYILSCHFLERCLEWGTSIRGAWFDTWRGKLYFQEMFPGVEKDKDNYIETKEEFIDWFIEFFQSDEKVAMEN